MADVKIRLMSPEDLIPYENNPRHNDEAVEAVMQSIRDFGFKNPVIVDKKNVIIAGHTRIKAAIRLGLEKVPVIRADDLTEEQAKAYRLVDNKTGELCARAIRSSTREGDVIYDFFGGSGTTLIAAEQLGRKCAMMELDPGYCDVIIRRWEKLTGKKAERING